MAGDVKRLKVVVTGDSDSGRKALKSLGDDVEKAGRKAKASGDDVQGFGDTVKVSGDKVRTSSTRVKDFGDTAQVATKHVSIFRKVVVGAFTGGLLATAAVKGFGLLAGVLKSSVSGASDLSETLNKVDVVLGAGSESVKKWAQTSAAAMGQSKRQALDAAATFGVFGKTAGLSGDRLAGFSINMTKLASDMASFSNTSPQEAIEDISSALQGESEPIRKYGVLLDEATLKARGLSLGLVQASTSSAKINSAHVAVTESLKKYNAMVKEHGANSDFARVAEAKLGLAKERLQKATEGTIPPLTQQQRVLAAQAEIMAQTKDAQGDFARTSGGLANQQRILAATIENVKAKMGQALLPIVLKVVSFIVSDVIPGFETFANAINNGTENCGGFIGVMGKLGSLAGIAFRWIKSEAVPALKELVVHMVDVGLRIAALTGWFNQHRGAAYALGAAILYMVVAQKAYNATMAVAAAGGLVKYIQSIRIVAAVTRFWAAQQWILNLAMRAFPVFMIITAIAAVVAGIIYAYKHFEGFRNVVNTVFRAVGAAAMWLWNNALRPALTAIVAAAIWVGQHTRPAFASILNVFGQVVKGVAWYWNNVMRPVFGAIAAIAIWLWDHVLKYVFAAIRIGFIAIVTGIAWFWNNVLKPTWGAVALTAKVLWGILKVIFAVIAWAWSQCVGTFRAMWETVLRPVWNVLAAVAKWLYNNVLKPTFAAIAIAWTDAINRIRWVWEHILRPVWNAIKGFIDRIVMPMWRALESGIKGVFDRVGKVATGFKNTVVGVFGGLVNGAKGHLQSLIDLLNKAIRAVNKILPGKGIPPIPAIVTGTKQSSGGSAGGILAHGLANGGRIYGPGSGTSDSVLARVSNGEWVVNARSSAKLGHKTMDYINKYGELPKFATGGFVQNREGYRPGMGRAVPGGVAAIQRLYRAMGGNRTASSTYRPGDPLWHGSGLAVDFGGYDQDTVASRLMSVRGGLLELIHSTRRRNYGVSRGREHNMGSQLWAEHKNHLHLAATPSDVASILGGQVPLAGGGSGGFSIIGSLLGKAMDLALKPFNRLLPKGGDIASTAIRGAFSAVPKGFKDFVLSKFGGGGSGSAGPGQLGAWISEAMKYVRIEWVEGLRTLIMRESGGNPRATNNWDSNAQRGDPSRGLMQTIGSTFAAYRDRRLPNDIFDPIANIVAGMNYIHSRYKSLFSVQQAHADQPPKGYRLGIRHAPSGPAWVGEDGPELLNFRGGESVTPVSAGGGDTYHFHFHGPLVGGEKELLRKLLPHLREEMKKAKNRNGESYLV